MGRHPGLRRGREGGTWHISGTGGGPKWPEPGEAEAERWGWQQGLHLVDLVVTGKQ